MAIAVRSERLTKRTSSGALVAKLRRRTSGPYTPEQVRHCAEARIKSQIIKRIPAKLLANLYLRQLLPEEQKQITDLLPVKMMRGLEEDYSVGLACESLYLGMYLILKEKGEITEQVEDEESPLT